MNIIDISFPITKGMITYPKNPKFRVKSFSTGHSMISKIVLGTHTGTHVDVPRHVFKNGKTVEKMTLDSFFGSCKVFDFSNVCDAITVDHLSLHQIKKGDRVLIKTANSKRGFKKFYNDYVYLDGDAADWLAKKGIALFGIDALSVKKRGGSDQRPHTSLLKKNIPIVEGLDLSKVKGGNYTFIGLPLRLNGLDGSPVRAVLIKEL
ncbi:MAG: cyclase [Candidatus Harrisonbacteria bacterium CG10_big_fil_rev_8_21_14_0_10_42_17]|uniref:Kynurenine formamidase n=1 Tax=Candidatus Harrisonbacteria bacterium CG10_big_fil_rev_8_21_14_0_10_42_17 TaxID=1974584 RepID=A0A2M6WJ69_9BACT|nr:MAG: cyclase [Candidatus Harrisonbacteria bacterium CG10_big_fil_rev_8_21_14_0_10_42_17]